MKPPTKWYAWIILLFGLGVGCQPATERYEPVAATTPTPEKVATILPTLSPDDVTWVPLPTIQPRPEFIVDISPPESSTIPWEYFRYEHPEIRLYGFIDLESGFSMGYGSRICVNIDLGEVVQSGDDLNISSAQARMQLRLVGTDIVPEQAGGLSGLLENYSTLKDATWESFTIYCWQVPLGAGTHTLNLQFRQTSGSILEYTWQFALSDE